MKLARRFCDDVEFSAMDASRSDLDYLCQMIERPSSTGPARSISRTPWVTPCRTNTGGPSRPCATGCQTSNKAIISVHCHNDLGLAVANSMAAIENGARQVECTINGIGERAGNASMEEIVMILKTRADKYPLLHEHQHPGNLQDQPPGLGPDRAS